MLSLTGLANLGDEFIEVLVRFSERILSFQLGTKRDLEKLRGWKVALLELIMEVIGQVHLNAWHAPNYTPTNQ